MLLSTIIPISNVISTAAKTSLPHWLNGISLLPEIPRLEDLQSPLISLTIPAETIANR
jgi:hypothetical protein